MRIAIIAPVSSLTRLSATLKKIVPNDVQVIGSSSIETAYSLIVSHTPEVVALSDFSQTDHSDELVEYLVAEFPQTRLLLLSGQLSLKDRLLWLRKGIDDVVNVTCGEDEICLRIRNLYYRRKIFEHPTIKLTPKVYLYPEEGMVSVTGRRKRLRKKEMEILQCLCLHRNRVVGKDQLIRWVWGDQGSIPSYTTIEVYIGRIRNTLSDPDVMLETIRGFGYRLADATAA